MNKLLKTLIPVILFSTLAGCDLAPKVPPCTQEVIQYARDYQHATEEDKKEDRARQFSELMKNSPSEKQRCCLWDALMQISSKGVGKFCDSSNGSCKNQAIEVVIRIAAAPNKEKRDLEIESFRKSLEASTPVKQCCLYNELINLSDASETLPRCTDHENPPTEIEDYINGVDILSTIHKNDD